MFRSLGFYRFESSAGLLERTAFNSQTLVGVREFFVRSIDL